jgi:cell wall-associated NlpC family hydrolase
LPNYQAMAASYARQYGVPVQLFQNQIHQESGFNPNARSGAGALGIAQFMPSTAQSMGVNPMDPRSALDGAARLMADNYHKYGSWARALSAYNSGRPDAYKDPGFAGGQTYNYVKDIMGGLGKGSLKSVPAAGKAAVTMPGGSLGLGGAQNALAAQMLQQAGMTAAGQGSGDGLLAMAMARQQMGAAQNVYGKTTVQVGDVSIHGVSPASPHDVAAVKSVESFIGTPYQWGGAKPGGFDCSGLLQYVWGKQGVSIPRTTYQQWSAGQAVSKGALRPGDAVFFKGSDSRTANGQVLPGHVGMYIGGGKFVEAPHTGSTVHISTLAGRTDFMGARRFA